MSKQLDQLTDVFISDEVLLMCHNLALLTEKEEVAALLIGQKIVHENGITVSVTALSIPPRGEIKKDRVEIMSEDLVNAMEDAKHFSRVKGANLNVIGWYHSHPHITVWPSNVDLQTQLNLQNMDSCFIGIICSSYNTDTTTMMKEMKTVCFQAKQINGMVHRIDVKFQVAPTTCTSQLSFGVIVKHIETLYDELIKNYNEANEGVISPMAQLHNDSVYTLSGIHMLETVAKPMLQMLETQRESSTKRIQSLQTKLEQLSLGINDEHYCDGTNKTYNDQENSDNSDDSFSTSVPTINQPKETKKGNKSSMVSSPV
ncbi:lys-63-specific deubiquitinase BRCC36 [Acyrthosiphon pisum]|uniref:MPN domain-containing protein n=1 Tax=Acyrthosiphon pisum TaxID=7029 RepID=A0A8R1W3L9_ACYPI|nr:lys-63-specific deubiquitinase BRCC36 [Acyrthosiphon pisum]|eukprot:XP_001948425.1 PREDICTED: lys-63-specific deubiquitinase BRCC36 [Acyrthosiphon pisum]